MLHGKKGSGNMRLALLSAAKSKFSAAIAAGHMASDSLLSMHAALLRIGTHGSRLLPFTV